MASNTVCVTGGTGFIALHVVQQLLRKGYTVHATVRSISNGGKRVDALKALAADTPDKLQLFEADLLTPASYDTALAGCVACFHTASPFFTHGVEASNAMELLVTPAVEGTRNVLAACARQASIQQVILTSSCSAIVDPTDENRPYSEEDWNTTSKAADGGLGSYHFSKAEAERVAWKFVEENKPGFTLATINPPLVLGTNLGAHTGFGDLNSSSQLVLGYLTGMFPVVFDGAFGLVDVEDVARAHIAAFEKKATGRFLCAAGSMTWWDFSLLLKQWYPSLPIPSQISNKSDEKTTFINKRCKEELGIDFIPMEQTIKTQCEALIRLGLVPAAASS